ncbi:MAG: hypothetical protein Q9228_003566 [Teloschistes exilis]
MLHHKTDDKANHYLELLDTARCNGSWSEVPELARKVAKHAPQRKCLQLTAQAECQIANHASARGSSVSVASSKLSQLVPDLLSVAQESTTHPPDAFQARICLGWLHWTLEEPERALQRLPTDLMEAYKSLGEVETMKPSWTSICAVKGACIRGEMQETTRNYIGAHTTYDSILPHVMNNIPSSHSCSEYRHWTERYLIAYCSLSNRVAKMASDHGPPDTGAILAPFRVWADFWASTSKFTNSSGLGKSKMVQSSSRRRTWQLYYDTLSEILQRDVPYPLPTRGPSVTPREISSDNVKSLENSKLLQSIELKLVEGAFEEVLLKEVAFPKANEVNVEVESWVDHIMANWRTISGSAWRNEDIGTGGKEALTRNILAVLYRAATRTFHSTRVLRHLFTVHTALAEFSLAARAFDTYIELVGRGKARAEKSGEMEIAVDDDDTVFKTTAAGIQMLCSYGQRKHVEKAQEVATVLEKWLEQYHLKPTVNADDHQNDGRTQVKQSIQSVSDEAFAVAYRSLGMCRAHWARLTYDISSRPDLQMKAIASFRQALIPNVNYWEQAEILYDLSLVLAETRDIEAAIDYSKSAISICTREDEEGTSLAAGQSDQERRVMSKAWHLLAFLLSAKQDFETAMTSINAACDPYVDLIEGSKMIQAAERLALCERESILELKMTQLTLSQILDGPAEAVNGAGDVLSLFKELFRHGDHRQDRLPPAVPPLLQAARSPFQSANGSVRSSRRSILGRSKGGVSSLRRIGHHSHHGLNSGEGSVENDGNPANSVLEVMEKKYQPPHHLARQESKKLHKRQSRKSMTNDRQGRGISPNKSSVASGSEGPGQALPLRIANLKRSSLEVTADPPPTNDHAQFSDQVGLAVTKYTPLDQRSSPLDRTSTRGLPPTTSQSTYSANRNPAPEYPEPPPSAALKPLPVSSRPMCTLPDPMYPSQELSRHALTLLTRIWLLIAKLYRDAAMSVDAQGALSEAFSHAQSIEALVASTDSSALALSTPGWGNVKSVAEVWADVHAEQAALHVQFGNTEKASGEFEKAIGWLPDHNAATVGLSNMLLDYWSQKTFARSETDSAADLPSPEPILASLPYGRSSKCDSDEGIDTNGDTSPTLLSRLAARDRAYGMLSMLTKSGQGWDDSEAWFALARTYEESGQIEKAKEALCCPSRQLIHYVESAMADKKRKRISEDVSARPHKKTAREPVPAEVVKVSFLPEENEWAPIVASTPGLSFPQDLPLKPFRRPRKHNALTTGKSAIPSAEHLLHTSAHLTVDYLGREEEGDGAEGLLKHYIGVFDEQSGQLQLVRSRKIVLRGMVRSARIDTEAKTEKPQGFSARSTLGLEFGNKKSQRAIQNLTRNAIAPPKHSRSSPGSSQQTLDPIASAVVSSMTTTSMPSREDLQTAVDDSKPRPKPNLAAETPAEVYTIDQLVGPGVLRQITVKEWQDAVENKQDILTKSRFVSHRIQSVVSSGDVRRLKTLKYLLLLLEWKDALIPAAKMGHHVRSDDKLREKLGSWGSELVRQVSDRFSELKKYVRGWHLDNLITHICALAITIDNFTTDVSDIKEDLRLENKSVRKYFKEIGAMVVNPTESERAKMKISKAEGVGHQLAKLRLPLEFPKLGMQRAKRKYPLFALIIYLSVTSIRDCRSPSVTVGYGIGLLNAWTILWSATLIIFNDARRDYRRIERQEREDTAAADERDFVENIQGETSALDGSTMDGLKALHPVAEIPQTFTGKDESVSLVESPEVFGPQDPIPSDSLQTYIWQSLPATFVHRCDFIMDLVTNFRGLRWTHQVPGTLPPPVHIREVLTDPAPPPPLPPHKYPSHRSLLISSLQRFILCSLTLDGFKYVASLDPYFFAQGTSSPSPFPAPRTTRLVISVFFAYASLLNIFLLAPLGLACALGPRALGPHASTWLYPPYFGPLRQISEKGLAGLWGGWWHQLFRYAFETAGEFIGGTCLRLPKKSVPGSVVRVTAAFVCSGILHACASYTSILPSHPIKGSFLFFALQPVGIVGQRALSIWLKKEGYREAIPPWMRGVGNVAVVLVWCWLTGPLIADDFAAVGIWLYEPLPISLIRGVRGEGWWRWGGEWVRWYSGDRWWRSGLVFLGG